MEVVCDDYLYIWHLMFGIPGSKNDINIMNASPLFSNIRAGKWPPCRPQIDVLGFPLSFSDLCTNMLSAEDAQG
jgi:hypothetical protein